ncbi:MAG: aldehyde dehydrogenase family protein, partial [Hyphomicrobiaceae bacterium]
MSRTHAKEFFIDGAWTAPASARTIPVIDPATESSIGEVSLGSAADVDKAVKAARAAFESFSQTSVEERADLLGR